MTASEETLSVAQRQRLLGRAIRELRARRGFSQEVLGFEAGIHRNDIGALERGETNPTFSELLKLVRGLDVPLSALLRLYERRCAEEEEARADFKNRIDRVLREEADVLAQLHDGPARPDRTKPIDRIGQEHAAVHLARLGLGVVERDFRTRWGTIDLIAHDGERLVFCEVATRRLGASPPKTLSHTQRRDVRRAGTVWLEQTRATAPEVRFDAIDVTINAADELVGLEHRVLTPERTDGTTADLDPGRSDR